jgi:hypothetical protein
VADPSHACADVSELQQEMDQFEHAAQVARSEAPIDSDWQSDFLSNAQIMSSVTRYWPELASLSSFARILKAFHPFQIESYPPI